MRLILSRKGFDSGSGGCPSPVFPDGSMLALPIPDRTSPVRYQDLTWRRRNVGEVVETLTRGKVLAKHGAHLDPDLRAELRPRLTGWRPVLGQLGPAHGHLRNEGVTTGDLFLFWGLFRGVDARLRWDGPPFHAIWGWLQVDEIAPVDAVVRRGLGSSWAWAARHPHLAFAPDDSNTLYVAAEALEVPNALVRIAGAGVFDFYSPARRLTRAEATGPGQWSLPAGLHPTGRKPLTYHQRPERWQLRGDRVLLEAASRGQEFVLDGDAYPEALAWAVDLVTDGAAVGGRATP